MQAFNGRAHDSLTPYLRRDVRGVHPSPSHYQSYLKSALGGIGDVVVASVRPSESFMASLVYETGIPGLFLFFLFMAALMVAGVRSVRACRHTDMGLLAAAFVGFQVTIWLQSWSYDPLHFPPSRVMFWFLAGVLLSLPRLAATAACSETRGHAAKGIRPEATSRRTAAPVGAAPIGRMT